MSLQPNRPPPALTFAHETPQQAGEIEALLNRAFGPGRFAKVSERVREVSEFAPDYSFCALEAGRVLGVVRMWRVSVDGRPAIFLGPLAVEAADRKHGLGALLVEHACRAAEAAGEGPVVLVGDLPFFSRVGFRVADGIMLPGPVDAGRVLVRGVAVSGTLTGR